MHFLAKQIQEYLLSQLLFELVIVAKSGANTRCRHLGRCCDPFCPNSKKLHSRKRELKKNLLFRSKNSRLLGPQSRLNHSSFSSSYENGHLLHTQGQAATGLTRRLEKAVSTATPSIVKLSLRRRRRVALFPQRFLSAYIN